MVMCSAGSKITMSTQEAQMTRGHLLLMLIAMSGCGDKDTSTSSSNGLTTTRFSATTNNSGIAQIEIEVDRQVDIFSVYAESDQYLSVEAVREPNGNIVLDWGDWDGNESLTSAIYIEGNDTVINWPVREVDGTLTNGTWIVEIAAVDSGYYYAGNTDIDVAVQTRADSQPKQGKIAVEVVYAADSGSDADVVSATEAAVDRWREIWSDYGLQLKVSYRNATGLDASLTDLSEGGSSSIASQSAEGTNLDILVLIGEEIGNLDDVYGISGGIPGTPMDGPRSAVVISWLANAGGDGTFSEDDIRLYGETLAHEVGHYTGLFHPVEDGWRYYDALSDTSSCTSTNSCESDLGDNLMFPYPVCTISECTPQDQLSGEQQGVMHRYIGTL